MFVVVLQLFLSLLRLPCVNSRSVPRASTTRLYPTATCSTTATRGATRRGTVYQPASADKHSVLLLPTSTTSLPSLPPSSPSSSSSSCHKTMKTRRGLLLAGREPRDQQFLPQLLAQQLH